jgi:hypothetical protein
MTFIVLEETLVQGSILPDLFTIPVLHPLLELSEVSAPIWVSEWTHHWEALELGEQGLHISSS